jgi:hypothetical protein
MDSIREVMSTLEEWSKQPSFRGLSRQQLLNPEQEIDMRFSIWCGAEMELREDSAKWGMVPLWTPASRFEEVSMKRRCIAADKLTNTPSYLEENGAIRGVMRCEGAPFQPNTNRVMIKAGTTHWSPVLFNWYRNKESGVEVMTFSVVTRLISSFDLRLGHSLQVPLELPDPLRWLDLKMTQFKTEQFLHELLQADK